MGQLLFTEDDCFDEYAYDIFVDEHNFVFDEDLIAIADLGLWDGRRPAFMKLSNKFSSFNRIIQGDTFKINIENNDIVITDYHHDGTNYSVIRVWKSEINDDDKNEMLNNYINTGDTQKLYESTNSISKYFE